MTMEKNETAIKWGLWSHIIWYVLANVGQVFTWWFATPDLFFWPLWSIVGWGIGLVAHFVAVRAALRLRHA